MDIGTSVIGTGLMGSALAQQLCSSGQRVTVWNRSPVRSAPLAEHGASIEEDATAAITAHPVTIICISSAEDVITLLESLPDRSALNGRCIINLSTGSIEDAQQIGRLVAKYGGTFLDGTILVYPAEIGTTNSLILYAGDYSRWSSVEPHVAPLAPDGTLYLGDRLDLSAILDVTLTGTVLGVTLSSFFEGAAFAASKGVDLDLVEKGAVRMLGVIQNEVTKAVAEMKKGNYETDQATLDVWRHGIVGYRDAIVSHGQPAFLLQALVSALDDAKAKGYAESAFESQFQSFQGISAQR